MSTQTLSYTRESLIDENQHFDDYYIVCVKLNVTDTFCPKWLDKLERLKKCLNISKVFDNLDMFYIYLDSINNEKIFVILMTGHTSEDWAWHMFRLPYSSPVDINKCIFYHPQVVRIYIFENNKLTLNIALHQFRSKKSLLKRQQTLYMTNNQEKLWNEVTDTTTADEIDVICYDKNVLDRFHDEFHRFNSSSFHKYNVFEEVNLVLKHIDLSASQNIVLIIVDPSLNNVLRTINNNKYYFLQIKLKSIYIYEIDRVHPSYLCQMIYFIGQNDLVSVLTQDAASDADYLNSNELIFSKDENEISLRSLDKVHFELLTEYLTCLPQTESSKKEMIEECRRWYQNDSIEQRKIDEFEEKYFSADAISWYTRNSFLYRSLNNACRTENIDLIYTFRFYIHDLYQRLRQLHMDFIRDLQDINADVLHLYRGQRMSSSEFQELKQNIGKLYSTTTFLSATFDPDAARLFASFYDDDKQSDYKNVLFKYIVNHNLGQTKPFADISEESVMQHEREVLFCMGSVFRIDSIQQSIDNNIWNVNATLVEINEQIQPEETSTQVLLKLGDYAVMINEFDKAELFYHQILEDDKENIDTMIQVYERIARLYTIKNEYSAAIEMYQKIIALSSDSLYKKVEIHMKIAQIYNKICEYAQAVVYFELALDFFADKNCTDCAKLYSCIGDMHSIQRNWSAAQQNYMKALVVENCPEELRDTCRRSLQCVQEKKKYFSWWFFNWILWVLWILIYTPVLYGICLSYFKFSPPQWYNNSTTLYEDRQYFFSIGRVSSTCSFHYICRFLFEKRKDFNIHKRQVKTVLQLVSTCMQMYVFWQHGPYICSIISAPINLVKMRVLLSLTSMMIEFDTVHYLAMVYFYLPSDFVFIIIARKWLCRAVRYYELEPGITSICDLVCDVGRIEIFRAYIMRNKSHNEKVNKTLDYLYPNLDVHKSQYLNRLLDHCVRRLSPIGKKKLRQLLLVIGSLCQLYFLRCIQNGMSGSYFFILFKLSLCHWMYLSVRYDLLLTIWCLVSVEVFTIYFFILIPIEAWFFDPLLTILQKYDNDERNENKPEVVQNGVDIKCRKQRRRKQKRRKQKLRKGNR
ncbi:unnamed protein product [Rotaria sp. Silwood2]|nr:unnamed protein product [Rotaria sp. Silwood2]